MAYDPPEQIVFAIRTGLRVGLSTAGVQVSDALGYRVAKFIARHLENHSWEIVRTKRNRVGGYNSLFREGDE